MAPTDPRVVANYILDTRELFGRATTHVELQKLLFFCYESFLIATRRPLSSGYFEAWQYGPVHPVVYSSFKSAGAKPIQFRAEGRNVLTRANVVLPELEDGAERQHIAATVARLLPYSASQLIRLSHAHGGPWHSVMESAKDSVALGLRIADSVILGHRPRSMLVGEAQPAELAGRESYVESPPADYRLGKHIDAAEK
jgi:uncharacterized phage-associated protein